VKVGLTVSKHLYFYT